MKVDRDFCECLRSKKREDNEEMREERTKKGQYQKAERDFFHEG